MAIHTRGVQFRGFGACEAERQKTRFTMNGARQTLTSLCFELNKVRDRLATWKRNGGDLSSLGWSKGDESLCVADVGRVLGFSLPDTAASLMEVRGNIAPHK